MRKCSKTPFPVSIPTEHTTGVLYAQDTALQQKRYVVARRLRLAR
jgi:hypothetical protein